MQVYNERILDLLSTSNSGLDLREGNKNLIVSGLTSKTVTSINEFWEYHE